MFLMAGWLFVEHRLGRPLLFEEGPDPTSLTASLFLMLLGLWAFVCGEVGGLRERVERLERSSPQGPGGRAAPGTSLTDDAGR
ncbi:MAG: hypothetical protein K2W96_28930 [Gemmataceae bacterium]|nr:hypothetical protein [Gemmataceae bacterium]